MVCDAPGELRDLLFCTSCGLHYHGTCLEITVTPRKRSGWQCHECKVCQTCRCVWRPSACAEYLRKDWGWGPVGLTGMCDVSSFQAVWWGQQDASVRSLWKMLPHLLLETCYWEPPHRLLEVQSKPCLFEQISKKTRWPRFDNFSP